MSDFISFVSALFNSVSGFLLSEPIIWFVGIFLLLAVVSVVRRIIN